MLCSNLLFCVILCILLPYNNAVTQEDYHKQRDKIKSEYNQEVYGYELKLNSDEERVDQILLKFKNEEVAKGLKEQSFPAAKSFFEGKKFIEKSNVFQIIKRMPKGAALHIHDLAMIDPIWMVKHLTYRTGCQMCLKGNGGIYAFSLDETPDGKVETEYNCHWITLEEAREQSEDVEAFDQEIAQQLTVAYGSDPSKMCGNDENKIWNKALIAFKLLSELVFTEETLPEYMAESFRQFLEDGVQYIEIRSLLMANTDAFDFDSQERFLKIFKTTSDKFKDENPDYIGSKIIKCDLRVFDSKTINDSLSNAIYLKQKYPNFMAGYDLVAQEDIGIPLEQYLDVLLRPSQANPPIDLPYFFHAGETNFYDTPIDWNLLDAILLNTTRIGHGYALIKHPSLAKLVKEKDIAVEVNPVSNQVLGYVADSRNHPVTMLLANHFPVVISSDDPALWGSLPLSHDFYYAFMANTGTTAGLRVLKKLAMNSLKYSVLAPEELKEAYRLWQNRWDEFILNILEEYRHLKTEL